MRPATAPPHGLTAWLVDAVRDAVADGRLAPGARLPASRTLAVDLAISRGVVVEAYRRLADEGVVTSRTGAGTVVTTLAAAPNHTTNNNDVHGDVEPPTTAAESTTVLQQADVPRLPLPPADRADGIDIDLSPGLPDLSAFPRAAWLRAERTVLTTVSHTDLGYGDPRGSLPLRRELTKWLARTRGIRTTPGEILIVAGVAQALALVARVLVARGTRAVAVEDPGSRGARDQLTAWGLTPTPVPVDADGLCVDALADTALDVAVLTPAHQFPTGVVLAPDRRRALLRWAAGGTDVDRLIVEDDYDAEHRYDRAPVAALHPSAPDRVVHTGSVSKTLAPGMRLGWLIAPAHLRAALIAVKHDSDLGSPALPQLVLAHLLASGEYERHLRRVRTRQRQRRDALLAGLRTHLPAARVEGIAAGLHLLVSIPGDIPDTDLAARAAAAGVRVHPLSWHRIRPGPPGLVLGYAAHPPDRLRAAAHRLGEAL